MEPFLALFDLVGDLARRRYQVAERRFVVLGLNHTEARVLSLIDRAGGAASQEDLSAMMTVDRSNAGRALKRLELVGHVERSKGDANRRTNLVRITESGRAVVAEIARIRSDMAKDLFGGLDEREARLVVDLLNKALAGGVDA